jgi:hypothetical protein
MSSYTLLVVLALIPPIVYVSCFVHEIGHAVVGRAVGFVTTSFGMGLARFWCVIKCRGVVIYFGATHPLQGLTFVVMPNLSPSRWQMAAFTAGGILANAGLALLALAMSSLGPRGNLVWLTIAAVNGVLAVICLVPFRFKVGKAPLRTDGALILQALTTATLRAPAPTTIQSVRSLRSLWESVGDNICLRLNLLSAAMAWAELEDFQNAEQILVDLESLPKWNTPIERFIEAMLQAHIAFGMGKVDHGHEALNAAEDQCQSKETAAGLFSVVIMRASAKVLSGDAAGSAADLDALMSDDLAERSPVLAAVLLAARIEAYTAIGNVKASEDLLAQYELTRAAAPSEIRDLQVYRAIARLHAQHEDWARAEPPYREVVTALQRLVGAWDDVADKTRLLQVHASVLNEARSCFEVLGKGAEFDGIVEPLANPEADARQTTEASLAIDRKLWHAGLRILLVNVICFALATWLDSLAPPGSQRPFRMLRLDLILCAILGFPLVVGYFLAGRLIPVLRASLGAVMLMIVCLPWVAAIMFLLPF